MNKPKIITLPKIMDKRGNLSFLEHPNQLPFELNRAYWIYDVPSGESRGSHAFKNQKEFVISLSGSFDVIINDGFDETKYTLNRSNYGLYIPNMYWRRLENFSTNSLALIISDNIYNPDDYIRDFKRFKKYLNV